MSNPKFKLIYQFELPQTKEVEETTEELDAQGIAIKVTRKTKKQIAAEFGIRRPNRSLYDEAEFYYNEMVGKGMSRGLLSSALLAKRLNNDGGVLTDKDNQERKSQETNHGTFETWRSHDGRNNWTSTARG